MVTANSKGLSMVTTQIKSHEDLIGLSSEELKALSPYATHQHYKGGLYQFLGPIMDSETKEVAVDKHGEKLDAWLHQYPHERQVWSRPQSEREKFTQLR